MHKLSKIRTGIGVLMSHRCPFKGAYEVGIERSVHIV